MARALVEDSPAVAAAEASAALVAFEKLNAPRDVEAARALLGRLSPDRKARDDGLTAREGEVLALLGEGLTNAEIGDRLYISRKTVEHHVGRVLAKLGLRSRSEAAAHAARRE